MKVIFSYLEYYYRLSNYIKNINFNITDNLIGDIINNEIIPPLFNMVLENPLHEPNEDLFHGAIESLARINNDRHDAYSIISSVFDDFVNIVESNIPDYNSYFQKYNIKISIDKNNKIVIAEIT